MNEIGGSLCGHRDAALPYRNTGRLPGSHHYDGKPSMAEVTLLRWFSTNAEPRRDGFAAVFAWSF